MQTTSCTPARTNTHSAKLQDYIEVSQPCKGLIKQDTEKVRWRCSLKP